MYKLDGLEVLGALTQTRRHARDRRGEQAIRRLEWVLCCAFDDVTAVEDAFEGVYGVLTDDAVLDPQQFESASRSLERAYDAWLIVTLGRADSGSSCSPERGKASRGPGNTPYLVLQPTERNAG